MKRSLYKGIPRPEESVRQRTVYDGRAKKSSNLLLISVAVIVIAVILGYIFLFGNQPANNGNNNLFNLTNNTNNLQNNTNTTNQTEEDPQTYLLGKAISEKNVSICKLLDDKKQDCYEALAEDSTEACLSVENYNKRKACVLYFSQNEKSTYLCSNLNEADELECGKAIDPCYGKEGEDRNLCLALLNKDPGYCQKEQCLFEYASNSSDWTVCNNFTSAPRFMACYGLADKSDHCDELGFLSERDHCYYLLATASNTPQYCSYVTQDSEYRFMCYNTFMLNKEDYTYCDNLDFNYKWKCLTNYALATADIKGCELIDPLAKSNYEGCYFNYAVQFYLPEKCNLLLTIASKYNCYPQAIQNPEKPLPASHCVNITDQTWKAKCYQYSALKNNDVSICSNIDQVGQSTTYTLCLDQKYN